MDVWEPTTLEIIHSFRGHLGPVRSLALSKGGKLLATGSGDNTVKLWDVSQIGRPAP